MINTCFTNQAPAKHETAYGWYVIWGHDRDARAVYCPALSPCPRLVPSATCSNIPYIRAPAPCYCLCSCHVHTLHGRPPTVNKHLTTIPNDRTCASRVGLRYNPNKVAAFVRRREMLSVFVHWARKSSQLAMYVSWGCVATRKSSSSLHNSIDSYPSYSIGDTTLQYAARTQSSRIRSAFGAFTLAVGSVSTQFTSFRRRSKQQHIQRHSTPALLFVLQFTMKTAVSLLVEYLRQQYALRAHP